MRAFPFAETAGAAAVELLDGGCVEDPRCAAAGAAVLRCRAPDDAAAVGAGRAWSVEEEEAEGEG